MAKAIAIYEPNPNFGTPGPAFVVTAMWVRNTVGTNQRRITVTYTEAEHAAAKSNPFLIIDKLIEAVITDANSIGVVLTPADVLVIP